MPKYRIQRLARILAAGIAAILIVALFHAWRVNVPLVSVILLTLFTQRRSALPWALFIGLLLETLSPLPIFTYVGAMTATFMILRAFVINFVSRYTVLGAAAAALLAVVSFEVFLFMLARVGVYMNAGWVPRFVGPYYAFFAVRAAGTVLLTLLCFFVARAFSLRLRGVALRATSASG